jgi:hypothetical protein
MMFFEFYGFSNHCHIGCIKQAEKGTRSREGARRISSKRGGQEGI